MAKRLVTIEDAPRALHRAAQRRAPVVFQGGQGTSKRHRQELHGGVPAHEARPHHPAELRGDEAFYFIRNCASGHPGSITSCHAGSTAQTWDQLALMLKASAEGQDWSSRRSSALLMLTIDIVVHIEASAGARCITAIDFDPERMLRA